MDTEANDLKVRENRLRRAAARQGLFLSRRRRRDVNALDFGRYALFRDGKPAYGVGYGGTYGLTLGQVEAILAAGAKDESQPPSAEPVAAPPQPQPQPEPGPHPVPPLVPRRRGLGARTPRRGR
jgi:hypothetical protein